MSRQTGSRCQIYERIDALLSQPGASPDLLEFIRRLQPILDELAYFAIMGDGAILESQEEWHTTFSSRLRAEESSDRQAARVQAETGRAPVRLPAQPEPRALPGYRVQPAAQKRAYGRGFSRPPGDGARRPQSDRAAMSEAEPQLRGHRTAGGLPQSLLAIMEGTHPSFVEDR